MTVLKKSEIIAALKVHYPNPRIELHHRNAFELIIAAILSAQATDRKVNEVTPELFRRYPTPEALADADLEEIKRLVKPLGFYNAKAQAIKKCSQDIVHLFKGQVPDTIEDLTRLHGVGRKTASVILVTIYHKPALVVDTHVIRLARDRLRLTRARIPDKIEADLARFFDRRDWIYVSQALVLFGRHICTAKKPSCPECALKQSCPYDQKTTLVELKQS